jgi:hypothetical protein
LTLTISQGILIGELSIVLWGAMLSALKWWNGFHAFLGLWIRRRVDCYRFLGFPRNTRSIPTSLVPVALKPDSVCSRLLRSIETGASTVRAICALWGHMYPVKSGVHKIDVLRLPYENNAYINDKYFSNLLYVSSEAQSHRRRFYYIIEALKPSNVTP